MTATALTTRAGVDFARRPASVPANGDLGWLHIAGFLGTGLLFLVGFGGVASGSTGPVGTLGFWAAVAPAWAWLATTSAHLMPRGESR